MEFSTTNYTPPLGRFDDAGVHYIESRYLSVQEAKRMRISAIGGFVYFPYFIDGEIFAWKARSIDDKKKQFVIYKDEKQQQHEKLPFFNMKQPIDKKFIVITEGEFDALAFQQLGVENVVSLPSGASSVESSFKQHFRFLQQFEVIYIAFDCDKAGHEAASKAMKFIPIEKYRRIVFPLDSDGSAYKDCNEWLEEFPKLDAADVSYLLLQAKRVETPSITHFSDLDDDAFDAIDLGLSTGLDSLDKILGGLRKEELTLITSETGSGKTTFMMNLVANLATRGASCWVNSFEMKHKAIRRKLCGIVLKKQIGSSEVSPSDREKYKLWEHKHKVYLNTYDRFMFVDQLQKEIEVAALAYKIDYVFIDHLDFLYNAEDKNIFGAVTKVMQTLHAMCSKYKIGIILVAHPRQVQGVVRELTFNDLKGGSCVKQLSENIIILTRKELINSKESDKISVSVVKNRELGRVGKIELRFDYKSGVYYEITQEPKHMPYKDSEDLENFFKDFEV